ncbi:MAG: exosortase H-associated membrane protein [Thiolinea sp.]
MNFVALGYQLGFLILPAIVPIAFWIMRHKGLLERLAQK